MNRIAHHLSSGTLVLALTGLMFLGNAASAQEKGAERLAKRSQTPAATQTHAAPTANAPMACPKCQDVVERVSVPGAKGAEVLASGGQPTKLETRHLCEGCSTKIVTQGVGKQAKDVAQHTCTACGGPEKTCCAMK